MNTTAAKRIEFQGKAKAKYGNKIILFRDNDLYFMYNEDAELLCEEFKYSLVLFESIFDNYKYSFIQAKELDQYLPAIVRHGHQVAICDGTF